MRVTELETYLDYENNDLSKVEKEALTNLFGTAYKVTHKDGLTFFEIDALKIMLNQVQNYYKLPSSKEIPETSFQPEKQRARWERGLMLEWNINRALSIANIDFQGNPLNPKHYPHSQGQHVDFTLESMLIEATNPKKNTHMNKQAMHEKIDYFHRADPEHKKLWVLVASHKTWDKEITQRLEQEQVTVLLINLTMHKRNIKRHYYMQIKDILTQLNNIAQNQNNTLTETINKLNKHLTGTNTKHVYQIIHSSIVNSGIGYCVGNFCYDAEFGG